MTRKKFGMTKTPTDIGCCENEEDNLQPSQISDDYLKGLCEFPNGVQRIPAGRIAEIGSSIKWVDGNGDHLTSDAYKAKYGIDPARIWKVKKEYERRFGPGVKSGDAAQQ